MKSIAIFIATGFLALPAHADQREGSTKATNKESSMTKVASFPVRDKWIVKLHQQSVQVRFNVAGRIETPTWTLLSLEATDLETDKTRRVWSIYHPWDIPVRKSALHEFTFGVRGEDVIALAYLVAGRRGVVNFYEIDLMESAIEKIPDQPLRPGAAYVRTASLLRSSQDRHILMPLSVLQETYGEEKAKSLFAEQNDLRIKNVAWANDHWKLTLTLGKKQFTFIREKDGLKWRLEGK